MNWKLPEVIWKPTAIFKRSDNNETCATRLVNDDDDDLGVNKIKARRDVPFTRLESSVRTFTDVALPVDLERLRKHKINIIRWRSSEEFSKLRMEYENSSQTVKQITRNLSQMDALRARVIDYDLKIFDIYVTPAKTKAMEAIEDFLALKEGIGNMDNPSTSSATTNDDDHKCAKNCPLSNASNERLQVTVQGNQLLIQNRYDNFTESSAVSEPVVVHGTLSDQMHEAHRPDVVDSWQQLEKDITDLHHMMQTVSCIVHEQNKLVDDISSNVEKAGDNIEEGTSQLRRATVLKAAMFPVIGAVVGGPIGMLAGLKLGGIAVAAAGITGTVVGYQGGKALKKRQDANSFEMKEIRKRTHSDTSTGSFEILPNEGGDT